MDEHFYYQTRNEDEVDAFFENIEYAFKAWDFPWSRDYSFEEFCRIILPYRYGNEVPEPWCKDIYEQFKWVLDSVKNPNDPMEAASFVNKQFNHKLSWVDKLSKNGIRLKISNQLEGNVNGICNEQAGLGVCVLRAMGIPATVVSIPKWGNLAYGHQVTGILDADGSWHYFNSYIPRLESLIGGEFSASDRKDFINKKKLYQIDTILKYNNNTLKCSAQTGKYFRYDFPQLSDSIFDGPAVISFYTTQGNTLKKIDGNYFGSPQLSEEHIKLMTDGDLLTFVEVWDCEKDLEIETGKMILRTDDQPIWIAMEVDTPIVVIHVGICPRNDKNGIYPGMRYELFYWDDAWKSLGTKVATSDTIRYDGIPENAVLWLRNLDEGKEERVFTLEDGEQIWW